MYRPFRLRGAGAPGSAWRRCAGLCVAPGRRALRGARRRAVRGAGAPGFAWRRGTGLCVARGRRALRGARCAELCRAQGRRALIFKKAAPKRAAFKKTRGMGKLEFKFSYHTAFYGAANLFINTYKLIAAAAQTNFFSVFKGMDTVSRFDTLP